jgi:hypothetical protein
MILADYVTDSASGFSVRAIPKITCSMHGVQDAPMDWL